MLGAALAAVIVKTVVDLYPVIPPGFNIRISLDLHVRIEGTREGCPYDIFI